jgi:membrane protein implicated in regulation of membrane protease activity
VESLTVPFDLLPTSAPVEAPTRKRAALAIAAATIVLTTLAVVWKLPFAGTAALLVMFLGSAWLAIGYWRAAFRR